MLFLLKMCKKTEKHNNISEKMNYLCNIILDRRSQIIPHQENDEAQH